MLTSYHRQRRLSDVITYRQPYDAPCLRHCSADADSLIYAFADAILSSRFDAAMLR